MRPTILLIFLIVQFLFQEFCEMFAIVDKNNLKKNYCSSAFFAIQTIYQLVW